MPYQSPGAAISNVFYQFQLDRAALQHQQLVDSLAVQRNRREDELEEMEVHEKKYTQGRQKALEKRDAAAPGTIWSPSDLADFKKYNLDPRTHEIDDPTAPKPMLPSAQLPLSNQPGTPAPPSVRMAPPQKVQAYRGTPMQSASESMTAGPMKSAMQENAPESVIRILATEEEKKAATQLRMDQFLLAEEGRMERAQLSSADRAASRESAEASRAETQAWRNALLELRRTSQEGGLVSLSPQGKALASKMYAKTGQLPAAGFGKDAAKIRTEIIDMAATYDPQKDVFTDPKTGIVTPGGPDLAANKASYDANKSALGQVTKTISSVESFAAAAKKNGDLLKRIINKVPDAGATFLNKPAREAMTALGSTDMTSFNILMRSLNNEYARLVSQPNLLGQLTDTARKEMESALRADATVDQIRVALDTLQQETGNRAAGLKEQQTSLTGAIKGGDPSGSSSEAKPGGMSDADAKKLMDELLKPKGK